MKASETFRKHCERWLPILHGGASEIVKSGEEHVPMLLAWPTPNDAVPIAVAELDKNRMAALHRHIGQTMPVCLIVEAWFVVARDRAHGTRTLDEAGGTLANHPDRKECIVFNFISGEMQMVAHCKINRATGELERGKLRDPVLDGSTGRFVINDNEEKMQ